jgi:hypothetical protein
MKGHSSSCAVKRVPSCPPLNLPPRASGEEAPCQGPRVCAAAPWQGAPWLRRGLWRRGEAHGEGERVGLTPLRYPWLSYDKTWNGHGPARCGIPGGMRPCGRPSLQSPPRPRAISSSWRWASSRPAKMRAPAGTPARWPTPGGRHGRERRGCLAERKAARSVSGPRLSEARSPCQGGVKHRLTGRQATRREASTKQAEASARRGAWLETSCEAWRDPRRPGAQGSPARSEGCPGG